MDAVSRVDAQQSRWTRREVLQAGAASAASLAAVASLPTSAAASGKLAQAARRAVVVWQQQPFALGQVTLLEGPFLQAQQRNRRFLMLLPNERPLHRFRLTAGLPSSAEPLGGWESRHCEIRGYFSGEAAWATARPGQRLVFGAEGIDGTLELVPFYQVLHERYSVHLRCARSGKTAGVLRSGYSPPLVAFAARMDGGYSRYPCAGKVEQNPLK
ncbi:beta-L-arabinofuranosidase domain-containing protein [Stenotrophomonas maltophilia]|uniref:Non-reducing end beta-L-arabinofuranosidase-like GH127 catalytic domain-containing protein n=1 Tax=Stenotrophomonas maltophilia TaxID=40324 RepID=A0A246ID77_STEMA|nr:beta-L-arabinofuranosidase domain-containing protein [Stenotrophomonas maltophilia]OWQ77990.1 hypothetical protein CEE63_02985 [Stenotrophomonas maltophilia]